MAKFKVGDVIEVQQKNEWNLHVGKITHIVQNWYRIQVMSCKQKTFNIGSSIQLSVGHIDDEYKLSSVSIALNKFDEDLKKLLDK